MMYLGIPGRMIGLKCPTRLNVSAAGRHSFATTLGGAVKAQVGPPGRRTWGVGLGQLTTPSEVGALEAFAQGAWGSGPWWFIPADAPVTNLLPPAAASCDPAAINVFTDGQMLGSPPLDLGADGFAARSVWKTSDGFTTIGPAVPVLPGVPVTGAAWIGGGGRVQLAFVDADGAQIGAAHSAPPTATPDRVVVTATPTEGAVAVRLRVTDGATAIARPTLTWTDQVYEWADGQGCPKAVVHSVDRDVTKAWENPSTGKWSDVSFVVQEVG